jgi:type IV pilus assembly protein PilM
VEDTEVRVMVVQAQQVLRYERLPLPEDVLLDGEVFQPTSFGQAVAGLIKRVGGSRKKVTVSVGGQRSLVRVLDLPSVPQRMLEDTVRRAARRELPLSLEELYLSWQVVSGQNDSRMQVFVLGVPRGVVDGCMTGLQSAGVRPKVMDLKPLALVRAVNLPDVLLVDLEEKTESVALVRGFVPYVVRSITQSGERSRALAERAERQVVEIQRTLDFYSSVGGVRHPTWTPVVCLTGALAGEEEIREPIAARWTLVDPAPPIPLPEDLPLLHYLVNIGLALKRAS